MLIWRVNTGSWLLRVLTWDAALPVCVALTPATLELFFPNRRGVVELTAVILPVAAFLIRLRAGRRHIASNQCPRAVQRFQLGVFCVGILPLALMECALTLSGLLPEGAWFATRRDRLVWAVLLSFYLASMVIAMYPGRAVAAPADPEDLDYPSEGWFADV